MLASTSSTAVLSSRQMTTSGLAATASAAEEAAVAPDSASGAALLGVRFQTVARYPRSMKVFAIADPISPRPSTVTWLFMLMICRSLAFAFLLLGREHLLLSLEGARLDPAKDVVARIAEDTSIADATEH